MGSGLISLNMLTSHWRSLLLAAVLALVHARPNSDDPQDVVEGSGDEEQDIAISEAVNKVVELVDEVVNDLNDKIEDMDMEVNLADNEISDKKTKKNKTKKVNKKKCSKCVKKHFRARNSELCDECDGGQAEATTAMTTPSTTTTTTTTVATTTTTEQVTTTTLMEFISKKKEQKIKERCQKCKKRNFRARNEDFCSEKCSDESEMEAEADEVISEAEAEEATTVKSRKAGGQKKNNKNNKKGKKSKEERQKLREIRKKNRSRKNGGKKTHKKFTVPLNKSDSHHDTVEVKEYVKRKTGPLESFIKFLFKKN